MNFTREPIIETVITPREGCKLILRNSKGVTQEDYYVDALEVVSFGNSIFYRSLERPKSFLLPVSDYEVIELKETRMVLKNVGVDRSIKIGGGKDASKEAPQEAKEPVKQKRRTRRKKAVTAEKTSAPKTEKPKEKEKEHKKESVSNEATPFTSLIPPPPKLIKEKLIQNQNEEILEANLLEEKLGESLEENVALDVPANISEQTQTSTLPEGTPLNEE